MAVASLAGWCSCKRAAPPTQSVPAPSARGIEIWPGLAEGSSDDLALAWTAPWLNGTFLLKEGHGGRRVDRRLASCADLDGIREADVQLGPAWEHENFTGQSIRCRALARTRRATAARAGYLADVIASGDPGDVLPAVLAPPALVRPSGARSWRAVDPTLAFDRTGARPDHRELVVRGAYRGRMTWWASGDFDGDGVADALVFLNLARTAHPDAPNVMRAFVVTRRQPRGPVEVLEKFE
jgi:hypothetical protein